MRGATNHNADDIAMLRISIHAPREGRDKQETEVLRKREISIHAPREGRDPLHRQ